MKKDQNVEKLWECFFSFVGVIFLAYANFTMVVSNINGITTETINEAITNEDFDNLILNATKSIRNIKKTARLFLHL